MIACGSSGAISPGKAAMRTIATRINAPTVALRFSRSVRRNRRGAPGAVGLVPESVAVSVAWSVTISRLSRSGIEEGRGKVGEQHADQHGKRVEEEEPLHQRQVVIRARRVEEIPEP